MNYIQESFVPYIPLFFVLLLIVKCFPLHIIIKMNCVSRETRLTKFQHKLCCRITNSSCQYCSCVFAKTGVTVFSMCAVWCSRINSTCTQGPDEGYTMETGLTSQGERVGIVVPRSVCLCSQSGGGASILLLT